MDVHPPHGAIHTWRDFFVHLTIITLGLLIALGLEGIVEWARHKHLVHTAEANLRLELRENRATLANNEKSVDAAEKELQQWLSVLAAYKANHRPSQELKFNWEWNGLSSAAWDTARNTGAAALMNYEVVERYSDTYTQQSLVNNQAAAYLRDVYRSSAPLQGGRRLQDLGSAEVDTTIANLQQTMADLKFLRDLSDSLSRDLDRDDSEGHQSQK